jgi:segregation and condensation protein B
MASEEKLKQIIEAALLAAGRPLNLDQLQALFEEKDQPEKKVLREVLNVLMEEYQGRGIEVVEVGSGFRIQVVAGLSPWVSRLWVERPPKYSRALLETLALIAYRQPITRGEIEDIRGVSVSSNIIKTLTEREWVRVVGHRDVPGKPALYATTKEFLDYFNLKSLNELPTLAEIRDLDSINRELELSDPDKLQEREQQESGGDAEIDQEILAEEAERLTDEVKREAPEHDGDAETDDEVIAEDSELMADALESEASELGETDRRPDRSAESEDDVSGGREPETSATSGDNEVDEVRTAIETADNVVELETELKNSLHEPE